MPSPSEIERQDQEAGVITHVPTLTERFLAAKSREAATQVEIASLERTLSAKRDQLKQQEAASAALLRELAGGGPASIRNRSLPEDGVSFRNFGSGARQAG